jgi:hypothetical protein
MKAIATPSSSQESSAKSQAKAAQHQTQAADLARISLIPGVTPVMQRKSLCPCDGGCPRCTGEKPIQPKLTIGQPKDKYEQEADRVADQVMRMPEPTVQRKTDCSSCGDLDEEQIQSKSLGDQITPLIQRQVDSELEEEEEETVQAKQLTNKSPPLTTGIQGQIQKLQGGGQPLPTSARVFFEPRFGKNFSQVRIHTDQTAMQLSGGFSAQAFTHGRNIFLNQGKYNPGTSSGNRLLAHELTHVVQQDVSRKAVDSIQRTVASNSTCAANAHNAPADPLAALTHADELAQSRALGSSHVLFLESLIFNDPTFGRSYVFDAYRDWFGTPEQTPTGTWQSRFRKTPFATEEEAMAHEMQTFSNRFERIHNWLAGNVRYRCPGASAITIPGCRASRCGTRAAFACVSSGSRTVAICPPFWTVDENAQAGLIIHEAIHPLFRFLHHSTGSVGGRGRNPGCYEGFMHAIYKTGYTPGDCSAI